MIDVEKRFKNQLQKFQEGSYTYVFYVQSQYM